MTFPIIRFLALLTLIGLVSFPHVSLADDTIYTKVDENPVPVKTPPPRYPDSLRRDGVSGVVAVTVVIDETGAVISSVVAKSSHPDFEKPALEAITKWKFKPGKKDGTPVKVKATLPLRFNLND
jgi:periplasmic protein TonB